MSASTPTPWAVEAIHNDGEYGDGGPDSHVGFDSFAIVDAKGRVLFDSLNRNTALTSVTEEHGEDSTSAWDEDAKRDAELIVRAVNCHADLLAALRDMVEKFSRVPWGEIGCDFAHKYDNAKAAIAKAEGLES